MDLKRYSGWAFFVILVLFFGIGYSFFFMAPAVFPSGSIVKIEAGATAPEVVSLLASSHIVAHPELLRAVLRLSGGSSRIQAGPYLFKTPQGLLTVAFRIVTGQYGIPPLRVTFPEGETVREAALRIQAAFPDISASDFTREAQPYEGYLFPDTYLFAPSSDADSIIRIMRANFDTKTASLSNDIRTSSHTLSDIVTMASLVEKEGRTSPVRHIIAGILWNRLRLGMPLQVDAVFGYIYGRDTYAPSFEDLKIASPYNTYLHTGLPPGPIDNPGLDSIDAALHPTKTNYLYYLTDKDGGIHYATTYAEHQANQRKYLK